MQHGTILLQEQGSCICNLEKNEALNQQYTGWHKHTSIHKNKKVQQRNVNGPYISRWKLTLAKARYLKLIAKLIPSPQKMALAGYVCKQLNKNFNATSLVCIGLVKEYSSMENKMDRK